MVRKQVKTGGEPQKRVLSSYFDSFLPPDGKRSTIKTFPKFSFIITVKCKLCLKIFEKIQTVLLHNSKLVHLGSKNVACLRWI